MSSQQIETTWADSLGQGVRSTLETGIRVQLASAGEYLREGCTLGFGRYDADQVQVVVDKENPWESLDNVRDVFVAWDGLDAATIRSAVASRYGIDVAGFYFE